MALPNPLYIAIPGLQNYFVDKDTAQALSAGYAIFYRDVARTVLKNVYQQVQLPDNTYEFVLLNNPVYMNSDGTFGDGNGNDINVYLFPYTGTDTDPGDVDLYYIEVYNSGGVLQFTREAWPPNVPQMEQSSNFEDSANQVSNSQFTEVNFIPDPISGVAVFNVSGTSTINIAPDWDIITSGSGTVTVKQVPTANTAIPTNPPYLIDILTAGISGTVQLRQRLTNTNNLFYGNYVSAFFVAAGIGASKSVLMSISYVPSSGSSYTFITDYTNADGSFKEFMGTLALDGTPNTDLPATGYIDVIIEFPALVEVQVSSVQLASVQDEAAELAYLQESVPRQKDHLFHYYEPKLKFKPINSLLVGWNFPFNPAQINGTSVTANTTAAYIWDQLIMQSAVGNLTVTQDGATGGLNIVTANNSEAFYLVQYLQGPDALATTVSRLASNLLLYASASNVVVKVQMFYSSANGTIPTLPTSLGSIAYTSGRPVFTLTAANWTEITQVPGYDNIAAVPTSNNDVPILGFNGLLNYASTSTTQNYAIVVSFAVPTSGTNLLIESISCVPGDIATRPAPLSFDESLAQCQYYYERSYDVGTATGTAMTNAGAQLSLMGYFNDGSYECLPSLFIVYFKRPKRVKNGTLTLYSVHNASATGVDAYLMSNGSFIGHSYAQTVGSFWNAPGVGENSAYYVPLTAGSLATGSSIYSTIVSYIQYHFVVDTRLGVV